MKKYIFIILCFLLAIAFSRTIVRGVDHVFGTSYNAEIQNMIFHYQQTHISLLSDAYAFGGGPTGPTPTVWMTGFAVASTGHAGTAADPYQSWSEPCAALNGVGGIVAMIAGTNYGARLDSGAGACSGVASTTTISILGNVFPIGNPIVFQGVGPMPSKGANPNAPTITNASADLVQLQPSWNYIEFQNINLIGVAANKNCFLQTTDGSHILHNNNLVFDHLTVSNCADDSLPAQNSDYNVWTNNIIHDSGAGDSTSSVSCIHPYELVNFDSNSGYHNFIVGNICYNENKGTGAQSDGNCINMDDFQRLQHPGQYPAYTASSLVANNICYNNDGDGMNNFDSNNVTTVNNTFYLDTQNQSNTASFAEIVNNGGQNNITVNNISVAKSSGYSCILEKTTVSDLADGNDNFTCTTAITTSGTTGFTNGAGNVTGNPNLTNATTNWFPTVSGAGLGTGVTTYAITKDYYNTTRNSSSGHLDIGAIQVTP